jgi:hypothetical protein
MKYTTITCMVIILVFMLFVTCAFATSYNVNVKRVGNNLYKDMHSGALIKTSLCLNLALGENATLIWNCAMGSEMFACGKLIFHESGDTCQVDAVYN